MYTTDNKHTTANSTRHLYRHSSMSNSIITTLTLCLLSTLLMRCHADHGDYVNQFVAYVEGGQEEANQVISHLQKRSAHVINTINSNRHGFVVHFSMNGIHSRSKRSSEGHTSISDLSSHPLISSIEQETEVIRVKRDHYTNEQIEHARLVVKQYLDELESKKQLRSDVTITSTDQQSVEKKTIQHDKQLELDEPLYYDDKNVFKRFKMADVQSNIEHRDYDPDEIRFINLNDEHWTDQWYLNNLGQAGGPKGLDINVVPAWQQGFSGKNVSVCVLDDGIEHTHDDLKDNYWAEISADFNDNSDDDPTPNPDNLDENSHGTRCAGEIAAKANNSVCGVGVAFNSRIGGVRILDGPVTDSLEADALLFKNQLVDIYSASWGPRDDGKTMEAPGKYCAAALEQGTKEGRGGKGSIFVWATGNGGYNGDDCAADGYVSSPYTLSIGSINNYAESTYFMEWCPSTLAVIYTGGFHSRADALSYDELKHPILKIVTTDVRNKCTLNFQGTSSAAPLAAGVMALALEANPDLTWRDVQHIVVKTSKVPNSVELGWTINGAGLHIDDKFGFGALDASQMVQVAQTWHNVAPQHNCTVSSDDNLNVRFDNSAPVKLTIDTDGCQKNADNQVDKLEHVQMRIRLEAARRGDIKLTLVSPAGTRSEMLSPRRHDDSSEGINFTFMTVRCWDESPRGEWQLIVTDTASNVTTSMGGKVISWSLTLLGTAQSTMTRDTADADRRAYLPNKQVLDHLMSLEEDAARNVDIKKGSELDVIQNFASNTQGGKDRAGDTDSPSDSDGLKVKIAELIKGMPKQKVQHLIQELEDKVEEAKRARQERRDQELFRRLEELLET